MDGIIVEIVVRELEKEGVGEIQATRIGKIIAKALGLVYGSNTLTDRHI